MKRVPMRQMALMLVMVLCMVVGLSGSAVAGPNSRSDEAREKEHGQSSEASDEGASDDQQVEDDSEDSTERDDEAKSASSERGSSRSRASRSGSSSEGSGSSSEGSGSSSEGSSSSSSSSRSSGSGSGSSSSSSTQSCDPPSHGSDKGHGANTDGPNNQYHNTCDGRPSDNGWDRGAATGRPCAGCVGNADDKNPPGQFPNGTDANSGYECDFNNGVGGKKSNPNPNGNPAHTGCRVTPADVCRVNCAPPPPCPPGSNSADCVPQTCPDGTRMQPSGKCNPPQKLCPNGTPIPPSGSCVLGVRIDKSTRFLPPGDARIVRAAPEEQVKAGVLPFTGGDVFPLLVVGLLLVASGALAVRRVPANS